MGFKPQTSRNGTDPLDRCGAPTFMGWRLTSFVNSLLSLFCLATVGPVHVDLLSLQADSSHPHMKLFKFVCVEEAFSKTVEVDIGFNKKMKVFDFSS